MSSARKFEALILPCLDAGYNLARWLLRDESAAEDVVQEASLRAFRYLDSLKEGEARPWFLKIVRNACYTHLEEKRGMKELTGLDEDELEHLQVSAGQTGVDPVNALGRQRDRDQIDAAIRALSPPLREVIVLRELEEMDYAEIAEVAGIPMGTVMSRLSRARARLRETLSSQNASDQSADRRGEHE